MGGMGGFGEVVSIRLNDVGYWVVVMYLLNNIGVDCWLIEMYVVGCEFYVYLVDVVDYDLC